MVYRLLKDTKGNFSIILAVSAMALLTCVGVGVDYTNMVRQQAEINGIVDAAAIAAATQAKSNSADRRKAAMAVFDENLALNTQLKLNGQPGIHFDDNAGEVTVDANLAYQPLFLSFLGKDNYNIGSQSTVSYAIEYIPPMSIALALDTSGSMSWTTTDGTIKIDALQEATRELFAALFDSTENPTLLLQQLSSGFSTYNTDLIISQPIMSGYAHIENTMTTDPLFVAAGGTDSTPSVQFAFDQLMVSRSMASDPKWKGYLLFLTDGDNNDPLSDDSTKAICQQAKDQDITIYTIAFAAPPRGEELLEDCASDPSNAFDSSDAQKLKQAFEAIGEEIGESVVRIKK